MLWTELRFGKHKGKTLPQVVFSDPDWFYWAAEERIFKSDDLKHEAWEIAVKASHIKIPQKDSEKLKAEYSISYTGKFARMNLVPEDKPWHEGSSSTFYLDRIDLSFPRTYKEYDKSGCRRLLQNFKFYYFGKSNFPMTRKRCEEFFENDDNFTKTTI